MKLSKKILSVVLCIILCFASVSVVALAGDDHKTVTVFVDGFCSASIINYETEEDIFPPSSDVIISAVKSAAPQTLSALLSGDYSQLVDPVKDVVYSLFDGVVCDENGQPKSGTGAEYDLPTDEEIIETVNNNDANDYVYFAYDWRISVQSIAEQLHTLVERIINVSDADGVNLVGFSMGTCVVMSYLKMYDYQYVDGVVLLAGAYNGVSACGQPFSGKLGLDSDATVRFVDAMVGEDFTSELVSAILHFANATGLLDDVIDSGKDIIDELNDVVYGEIFKEVFAYIPGMWCLCPYEDYEEARKVFEDESFSKEYVDTIDWYHYEVQAHNEEIIDELLERGIRFGIIVKYGYPNTPCIEDINSMSDGVIDTRYESFGATCADVNTTLGENYVQKVDNGHDCISPDNMIDASTAKYCQYTWFVKNTQHSAKLRTAITLANYILNADEQLTVWSDPEIPQFLINIDGQYYIMTEENDYNLYKADMSDETPFSVIVEFFNKIISFIKKLFGI